MQFSLRTMLIAIIVAAVGFAILRREIVYSNAVKRIYQLGGTVHYDTIAFSSICVNVDLSGTEVTDADLVHVSTLKPVGYINLNDTKITDAGIQYLVGIEVEGIYLENTEITAAGEQMLKQSWPRCRVFR